MTGAASMALHARPHDATPAEPPAGRRARSRRASNAASAPADGHSAAVRPAAFWRSWDARTLLRLARAVTVLAVLVMLASGALWLARAPWWDIRGVDVRGDLQRVNAATLRANTLPRLHGNFFTLDLAEARKVFESVPWVRQAVVQRVWPNRLRVTLQEHQPMARWMGADGGERLVNRQGEVFEANVGDLDAGDKLPLLSGPDGSAAQVQQMQQALDRVFQPLGRRVGELALSGRGSWSLVLDDQAEIELGRGTPDEVIARTQRFASTLSQVTGAYRAPLLSADLRHNGGYAVRLRGVTTIDSAASAGRP
jgi:cell division protein FtsQ